MRCIKFFVALSLSACIIFSAVGVSVSATDYTPSSMFYYRPTTGTGTIVEAGGGNSFPIVVNIAGSWGSNLLGLLVGAHYDVWDFNNGEQYTMALTLTTTVVNSLSNLENCSFMGFPSASNPAYHQWSNRRTFEGDPEITVNSMTYTIIFRNIPWDFIANFGEFGVFIPKASISNTNNQIYFTNCYLGLSSEFDEGAYAREVTESLNKIEESLDGVQDSLDGIQDSIDGILDEEEDRLNNASDIAKDDSEGAFALLKNYADEYGNIMEQFITICTTNDVLTAIPLPSGNVSIFGHNLDIFAGQESVDFSGFLEDPNIQIVLTITKCVTTLGILASAVHWAHSIKEWFTSDSPSGSDVPEIPFS